MTIDGVDRIAAVTEHPFYRSINAGSAGPDVAQLNALLARLGLPGGSGSTWTARTAQGVAELRSRLGLASVPRLEVTFDPAWVIRIPEAGIVVGSVSAHLGASAPRVGDTADQCVFTGGRRNPKAVVFASAPLIAAAAVPRSIGTTLKETG